MQGMPQLNRPQFNMGANQQQGMGMQQGETLAQRGLGAPMRTGVMPTFPGTVQDMQAMQQQAPQEQQYDDNMNQMPSQGVPMGTNNLPRFNNGVANGGFNSNAGTGRIPTKPREQFDIPSFISRSGKKGKRDDQ